MALHDSPQQEAALQLLREGKVTASEAAGLCQCDRQLVEYWCKRRGIAPMEARAFYLRTLWQQALR